MPELTGYSSTFSGNTSATSSIIMPNLGTRALDASGNEYIFARGTASVAFHDWCIIDENHQCARASANGQGRLGLAMAAIPLEGYGWYQIYGKGTGNALTGFADDADVYLTSTAGSVDDSDVAGDAVIGSKGRSAVGGGSATFDLNYPYVTDSAID